MVIYATENQHKMQSKMKMKFSLSRATLAAIIQAINACENLPDTISVQVKNESYVTAARIL